MDELTRKQVENNAASRDCWGAFRAHRDRVTGLLQAGAAPGCWRLCVLGAGNCNDLDLAALAGTYREIHLVDLDAEALGHGAARQGLAAHPALYRHGGLDLTGVLGELAAWSPGCPLDDEALAACRERPVERVRPALPGPFDVVASTCLLSQLVNAVVLTAGEKHRRFPEAVQAVRAGHLRLLASLVAPGGVGVLITDVVSSDSFRALASVPEGLLPALLGPLIAQRNFFHGVNPAVVSALLRTDPVLAPQVAGWEGVRPWLWDFGPRVYLVCAWVLRKQLAAMK
jgi:hypothetical protein